MTRDRLATMLFCTLVTAAVLAFVFALAFAFGVRPATCGSLLTNACPDRSVDLPGTRYLRALAQIDSPLRERTVGLTLAVTARSATATDARAFRGIAQLLGAAAQRTAAVPTTTFTSVRDAYAAELRGSAQLVAAVAAGDLSRYPAAAALIGTQASATAAATSQMVYGEYVQHDFVGVANPDHALVDALRLISAAEEVRAAKR